ncbi:MAG: SH3 domain-containing protein [Spirochaetes bacterium]|nr:SH3 domain-containing protein [Spirochaetota bacterium]
MRKHDHFIKIAIFILLCLIPLILNAKSDNAIELFKEGNEKYKKGEYSNAVKFYEMILSKKIKNGYLYFNLGNAYFKDNRLGKAILNFERARIYLPSDSDVKFNLKFANSRKIDRISNPENNPFTIAILFFYNLFSVNTLFLFTYLLFLILIASLIVKWFYRKISWQMINQKVFNYAGIAFLFLLFMLVIKVNQIKSTKNAIIISSQIKVKSGPSTDYTDIFTLHEGSKVRIRKENDTWVLITLPNGFSGWVQKDLLEKI